MEKIRRTVINLKNTGRHIKISRHHDGLAPGICQALDKMMASKGTCIIFYTS
jgi:hypothetical protein